MSARLRTLLILIPLLLAAKLPLARAETNWAATSARFSNNHNHVGDSGGSSNSASGSSSDSSEASSDTAALATSMNEVQSRVSTFNGDAPADTCDVLSGSAGAAPAAGTTPATGTSAAGTPKVRVTEYLTDAESSRPRTGGSRCWTAVSHDLYSMGMISSPYDKGDAARRKLEQARPEVQGKVDIASVGGTAVLRNEGWNDLGTNIAQAQVGDVAIYSGGPQGFGHIEIRTPSGWVSDFYRPAVGTSIPMRLIGLWRAPN